MKRLILLIVIILSFTGCESNRTRLINGLLTKNIGSLHVDMSEQLMRVSWKNGYLLGINATLSLQSKGVLSVEALHFQQLIDSIKFEEVVTAGNNK